jgi:hypothetical protein
MPSLAGGTAVLASKPRADGTRTMTLLRIPPHATEKELQAALSAPGIPLLSKVRNPRWSFSAGVNANGAADWKEEWPTGSPRPQLLSFTGTLDGIPDPVEAIFYIPPLTSAPQ